MDLSVLDKLDGIGGEMDGFFAAFGGALKTAASKALPIVKQVFKGNTSADGESGASVLVGAVAAFASNKAQKKLIDAQAKLANAQSQSQAIAAQAAVQKAQIDHAAAQTIINGMNKGIIPPHATYAEAGQLVVQEVVRSAGVDPYSAEGAQATRVITQAAIAPDRTLLYMGGAAAAALALVLFANRR